MSRKISGRVLPTHVGIFHSPCIPHAALHLGNSGEKLNVPVLHGEQNYGNEGCHLTWDLAQHSFQCKMLLTSLFSSIN